MENNNYLTPKIHLSKIEKKVLQYEKEVMKSWILDIATMQKLSPKIKGIYVIVNASQKNEIEIQFDIKGWTRPVENTYFITHIQIKPHDVENQMFSEILSEHSKILEKYSNITIKTLLSNFIFKVAQVNGLGNHFIYINAHDLNKTYEDIFGSSFLIEEEKKQLQAKLSKKSTQPPKIKI